MSAEEFNFYLGLFGSVFLIVRLVIWSRSRSGGYASGGSVGTRMEARRIVRKYEQDADEAAERMIADAEYVVSHRLRGHFRGAEDIDVSLTFRR